MKTQLLPLISMFLLFACAEPTKIIPEDAWIPIDAKIVNQPIGGAYYGGIPNQMGGSIDPRVDFRFSDMRNTDLPDRGMLGGIPNIDRGQLDEYDDFELSTDDAYVFGDWGSLQHDWGSFPQVDAYVDPDPYSYLGPDTNQNAGWIGGHCTSDADCSQIVNSVNGQTRRGFCILEEEGAPRGMCSVDCLANSTNRYVCPDSNPNLYELTRCVTDPNLLNGRPFCSIECENLSGCRPGYACISKNRYQDASGTDFLMCMPE